MNILVLNGSPRSNGSTKRMINAFCEGALSSGNKVDVVDVCSKNINGCTACEYCHTKETELVSRRTICRRFMNCLKMQKCL